MPIWSYSCKHCTHKFELIFLTFKDAEENSQIAKCPKCGKKVNRDEFALPAQHLSFFGSPDGYHKPAPSKRHSTKLKDKKGND